MATTTTTTTATAAIVSVAIAGMSDRRHGSREVGSADQCL